MARLAPIGHWLSSFGRPTEVRSSVLGATIPCTLLSLNGKLFDSSKVFRALALSHSVVTYESK